MFGVGHDFTLAQFSNRNNFTIQKRQGCWPKSPFIERALKREEHCLLFFLSFHFSLCETKYWKRALSSLKWTLFSRSNLLCGWQEKGNTFIHSLMCPFTSPWSLSFSASTEARKKSIKAYLNEEGQDTMAPSERWAVIREVDEESSSSTHSPVDKTRLWTSACADTAGQGNEWKGSTAGAINSPISHQHCSHRCFINILPLPFPWLCLRCLSMPQ